jgi:hypothetical protein
MDKGRLFSSLEKKLSANVGHRVDIHLADVRKINKTTAHFMLAFAEATPSSEDLSEYFVRQYNAKITPFISTAKIYPNQKVITVIAQILNVTRDYQDIEKSKMKPVITGATYLDVPLQEVWEVKERNGTKVLVRKVKDDIMAVVNARRNAMMDSHSRTTFASLSSASLINYLGMIEKGDRIRILLDSKVVDAEVLAASEGQIKVKHAGGTETVAREAVVEIVSKDPAKEEKNKERLESYFEKAYGNPEFATKLVK